MMETSFTFEVTLQMGALKFAAGQTPNDDFSFKVFLPGGLEITEFMSPPELAEIKTRLRTDQSQFVLFPYWAQIECEGLYRRGMDEPNEIMDFKVYLAKPDGRLDITNAISKAERKEIYDIFLEEVESHD